MAVQQPRVTLNDGTSIPQLGFGVWQVPPDVTQRVVGEAIAAGYRSIDTAEGYDNEQGVGDAIREAGVARADLYITSKLRNGSHVRDKALKAFDETMDKLKIDQLDLFLIHWPVPAQNNYVEAWKTLVELQKSGRIKSIGVSNFDQNHLEEIIEATGVVPVVNQIELHPFYQQRDKVEFHQKHKIIIESWSPLGQGSALSNPVITRVAEKHGKTPAQAIIRWHLDEGRIVIPKSVTKSRIVENFDMFNFKLDSDDIAQLAKLDDANGKIGPKPVDGNFLF
ncbi:aldo/keto reductase [Devosia sp.]|uniref:aldo/keto reductase n=1 Tax=Devosia sp. TaxID=1871048 RepID=UPI003267EDBC